MTAARGFLSASTAALGMLLLLRAMAQGPEGKAETYGPPAPRRPTPPAGAAPLAPVAEPFRTPLERRDLGEPLGEPTPIEGFWRLVGMTTPGRGTSLATGYLAAGRRHLVLCLAEQPTAGVPGIQSTARSYFVRDSRLVMSSLVGFRNEPDGDMLLEPPGWQETREFQVIGATLRIVRPDGVQLEFERVE